MCPLVASPVGLRDLGAMFELENLSREQPPRFAMEDLVLIQSLPRSVSVTQQQQELAQKQLEADDNVVVQLFSTKLQSDQARYKLYLEKLSDSEVASRRAATEAKLNLRRAAESAATALLSERLHQALVPKLDRPSFQSELANFQRAGQNPNQSRQTPIELGILDLSVVEGSLDEQMIRMATLLRAKPERSACLILLPWDPTRNISESIQHPNCKPSLSVCVLCSVAFASIVA